MVRWLRTWHPLQLLVLWGAIVLLVVVLRPAGASQWQRALVYYELQRPPTLYGVPSAEAQAQLVRARRLYLATELGGAALLGLGLGVTWVWAAGRRRSAPETA